ncbi:MAG: hypothetical protein CVU38_18350 [Chloroflexi bacterium HGW-Chloroflexi-1]|nr:MAG: hypothetical protein CVU38_18350 [Chloroflexi bacterium HGW-Chloroflexi-1]
MATQSPPKQQGRSPDRGITTITISGYKSLVEERTLEIRPLTILAGANSSGKSSALQPLLLLKQTLEVSYDPGALLLDGPNVRFTSAEQFLSKLAGRPSVDQFAIGVEIDKTSSLTDVFGKQPKKGIDLVQMIYRSETNTTTLRPEMRPEEILPAIPKEFEEIRKQMMRGEKGDTAQKWAWQIDRTRCFLGATLSISEVPGRTLPFPMFMPATPFELHLRRIIHVPGLRGNPERTYRATAVGSEFPGTFENYVASVIRSWQVTDDRRLAELGDALERLGLTWKVDTHQVDDTQVELRVGRLRHSVRGGARDMVSIADVGFGLSQILPVLVALLAAEPGQLVYLEQPEIHLHPRAQSVLARILADAASRGVRVVAETHSALLVLAVQSLVAEQYLPPEKVKLHWFKRREDGVTEITGADLDEAGAYGDWPEDFAEVALEVESRYLDAAERHRGLA